MRCQRATLCKTEWLHTVWPEHQPAMCTTPDPLRVWPGGSETACGHWGCSGLPSARLVKRRDVCCFSCRDDEHLHLNNMPHHISRCLFHLQPQNASLFLHSYLHLLSAHTSVCVLVRENTRFTLSHFPNQKEKYCLGGTPSCPSLISQK